MGNPLLSVAWNDCLLQPVRDRHVEAALKRELGEVPGWLRYLLPVPWVARSMMRLHYTSGLLVHLDFATADLIGLVVSQEHSCRFCYAATRALMRILGTSEERIQELEQRLAKPELDARGTAAVLFARRMSRGNPLVTARDLEPLRSAGFSDAESREIAFVVASTAISNRISTIPALPPYDWERDPDRLLYRVFRPVIALLVRRMLQRGRPVAWSRPVEGPFAELLQYFEGSPIAPALADTMEDLWSSPILTRRAKALMFAVIGRGLCSDLSQAEACRVLESEGMSREDVEHTLSHLGGADNEPLENQLMAFARDTISYEPLPIQRRARELREQLTLPQFVEALGVVSLANGICRLAAVLREPA